MSEKLELAVSILAYIELLKFIGEVIVSEQTREGYGLRTEEGKENFATFMKHSQPALARLQENIQELTGGRSNE